jgi:hypothetical protein
VTDPRRLRALVVDALDDVGASQITPGLGTTTARVAGRTVAVTVIERADEYVALDLHPAPDAPAPGWRRRFHVTVTVDGALHATVVSDTDDVGALTCAVVDAVATVTVPAT